MKILFYGQFCCIFCFYGFCADEEDMLYVTIIDHDSKSWPSSINGKEIYKITNNGNTSLGINALVYPNSLTINFAPPYFRPKT